MSYFVESFSDIEIIRQRVFQFPAFLTKSFPARSGFFSLKNLVFVDLFKQTVSIYLPLLYINQRCNNYM